jgi:hypothetical protein
MEIQKISNISLKNIFFIKSFCHALKKPAETNAKGSMSIKFNIGFDIGEEDPEKISNFAIRLEIDIDGLENIGESDQEEEAFKIHCSAFGNFEILNGTEKLENLKPVAHILSKPIYISVNDHINYLLSKTEYKLKNINIPLVHMGTISFDDGRKSKKETKPQTKSKKK